MNDILDGLIPEETGDAYIVGTGGTMAHYSDGELLHHSERTYYIRFNNSGNVVQVFQCQMEKLKAHQHTTEDDDGDDDF